MRCPPVRVYGNGRSGSAYADRLRQQGYPVGVYDKAGDVISRLDRHEDTPALLAILALPRGTDVPSALECIDPERVPYIVDLTTQSPTLATANADQWAGLGGRAYHAGGSNGGERAVRGGRSCLLLGPRMDRPVAAVLQDIGHLVEFPTLQYAVTLKLCHNARLVVENELARLLAVVCQRRGIALEHLEKVIGEGPAGRPFGELTAIRHLKGGYETSYVGEYAAKDWRYFNDMLDPDERDALGFVDVDVLEGLLSARGRGPWI